MYLNLTQGSREEDGNSYATYEGHIAYLASQKCNVIAIEGAPPFMLLGPAREAEMVEGCKRKYNTDMFTSSQNQVNAFKALKAKRILGITSGSGGPDTNEVYAKYFEDSGIGVVAMEGIGAQFKSVPDVPPATIASLHQEGLCRARGRRRCLNPGLAPRSASFDWTAGTRARCAARASDRRAHLGHPKAPPCPRADQGLWPPARNAPGINRPL